MVPANILADNVVLEAIPYSPSLSLLECHKSPHLLMLDDLTLNMEISDEDNLNKTLYHLILLLFGG